MELERSINSDDKVKGGAEDRAAATDGETQMKSQHLALAPDGSRLAWLQVAGSFSLAFNSLGLMNTYGSYQTFYEQDLLKEKSASQISWIGAIQGSLLLLLGFFIGPFIDRGYLRSIVTLGSFLTVFGMMMTSLCDQYWQCVIAQGVVTGIGFGLLFLPSVASIATYFTTRRALAMGIGMTGSSLGSIIYSIIFHRLQPSIGFGWATRVMAFISLTTLVLPIFSMRLRTKPSSVRAIIAIDALKEPVFALFMLVIFLRNIALYIPFFYVQIYAIEQGIVGEHMGFYLLAILNAGSIFGRIILTYVADKIGVMNTLIPCSLAVSILGFSWIAITSSEPGIIIFAILWGFFYGVCITLDPAITATITPNMALYGTRLGMILVPNALGVLIGNPVAGSVLEGGWASLQGFCGGMMLASTAVAVAMRAVKGGWGWMVKC